MLKVETHIAASEVHGIGLFASKKIKEGEIIWEFTPGIDIIITRNQIATLCESAQKYLYNYTYINDAGNHVLCADNARFINHSDTPNTRQAGFSKKNEGRTFASKEIAPNEEITENYHEFDPTEDLEEWFKNHSGP